MPTADVVVIGAGLAGLTAAVAAADRGARVILVAQGNGATHWSGGPIDVAAVRGAPTPSAGVDALQARPDHPYAILGRVVRPAVGWFTALLGDAGLPHVGGLDDPLRPLPTAAGATRPVAIVPESQAAALSPWETRERLVVAGIAGFKDLWTAAVAASLERPAAWAGAAHPARVTGVTVEIPSATGRRNLNAVTLAELFDDAGWRRTALDEIGRAIDRVAPGADRVALPAVLGRNDHRAVLRDAVERLGRPVFELPLVPPGIPGIRLYQALRAALLARGGRILLGEPVLGHDGRGRVKAIEVAAATRTLAIRGEHFVLATGGLAGGGIVGEPDGRLRETIFELPVVGPPIEDWLVGNPLDPGDIRVATAGVRSDDELRPVDPAVASGAPLFGNVRVIGAALAGQHYLVERCGDGVAIASGYRAAALAAGAGATADAATAGAATSGAATADTAAPEGTIAERAGGAAP